jgi:hypothetical protein
MKKLISLVTCILLLQHLCAQELKTNEDGIYCDLSLGAIPDEDFPIGLSLGLGWRFNRWFGMGPSVALFSSGFSSRQSITGVGLQTRFTPGRLLLFHVESGWVTGSAYTEDFIYTYTFHPGYNAGRFYVRGGSAIRFLELFQAGLDVFWGGSQAFDRFNTDTSMPQGVYNRQDLVVVILKLGISIPAAPKYKKS